MRFFPALSDREAATSRTSPVCAFVSCSLPLQVRNTLRRLLLRWQASPDSLQDLLFVTGTGGGAAVSRPDGTDALLLPATSSQDGDDATLASIASVPTERTGWRTHRYSNRSFSLGNMLLDALQTEYTPPLRAKVVENMAGCVVVRRDDLEAWAAAQEA